MHKLDPDDFTKWPSYQGAAELKAGFEPSPDVDYDWVHEFAIARYAATLLHFKELDDKALAIITYLGSGTGIFALGSLAALANAKLPPLTFLLLLPSIFFALLAIYWATEARKTKKAPLITTVEVAMGYAHQFKNAKAAFLPQWHLSMELFRDLFISKGAMTNSAMKWTMWSIGSLIVPAIGTATYLYFFPDPPKITEVLIR